MTPPMIWFAMQGSVVVFQVTSPSPPMVFKMQGSLLVLQIGLVPSLPWFAMQGSLLALQVTSLSPRFSSCGLPCRAVVTLQFFCWYQTFLPSLPSPPSHPFSMLPGLVTILFSNVSTELFFCSGSRLVMTSQRIARVTVLV